MSRLLILLFLLSSMISCAQKTNNAEVYERISRTFCNCVNKDTLASTIQISDSCLNLSIRENYTLIEQGGLDTSSSNPAFYKEISIKIKTNCSEYRNRLVREIVQQQESDYRKYQEEQKTKYSGTFISQTKLPNGEYELIIKSKKDNSSRTFISETPVNEKEATKSRTEVTVIFESNTSSLKTKYPFRAKSVFMIGIVETGAQ